LKDVFNSTFGLDHRYKKYLNRLLKVCYVPATSAILIAFCSSFFAVAINSTNESNKAAGMRHLAVYLLRCLWSRPNFVSLRLILEQNLLLSTNIAVT
jgi:hypothetical protein